MAEGINVINCDTTIYGKAENWEAMTGQEISIKNGWQTSKRFNTVGIEKSYEQLTCIGTGEWCASPFRGACVYQPDLSEEFEYDKFKCYIQQKIYKESMCLTFEVTDDILAI